MHWKQFKKVFLAAGMSGLSYREKLDNLGLYSLHHMHHQSTELNGERGQILEISCQGHMKRMVPLVGESRIRCHYLKVRNCPSNDRNEAKFFKGFMNLCNYSKNRRSQVFDHNQIIVN